VRLADGRRLAFTEWGLPDGKPVLYFHGSPGSRLWCPDEAATSAAGVRLIIADRPGVGRSDPLERAGYGDWPADVAGLADALNLATFPVVGVSAGGPYAAACAARIPDRVEAVALVSSGPLTKYNWEALPEVVERWGPEEREQFALLPGDPLRAATLAAEQFGRDVEDEGAFVASIRTGLQEAEGDRWFYDDANRTAVFEAHLREYWRQLSGGLEWELINAFHPWRFRLEEITVPVHLWHGAQDPWVSLEDIEFQRNSATLRSQSGRTAGTWDSSSTSTRSWRGSPLPVRRG
jgi:pimeloyl-ACP methyl ester carboxylesterase